MQSPDAKRRPADEPDGAPNSIDKDEFTTIARHCPMSCSPSQCRWSSCPVAIPDALFELVGDLRAA